MPLEVREPDVLALWEELLGERKIGLDTDFFRAGGTSLLALRLLQRIGDRYRMRVPLDVLVSYPTPRGLTRRLHELRSMPAAGRVGTAERPNNGGPTGAVADAVAEAVNDAWHPGVQLYVSIGGEVVLDMAAGVRDGGDLLHAEDLLPWFSGGKPLLAVAVTRIWRHGLLDLDRPVTDYLPEFASGRRMTTRHLLSHTGGRLIAADHPYGVDPATVGYEAAVATALTARLPEHDEPGRHSTYSASAYSWLLLSELVRRVDGRRFDRYVADEIAGPLGMEVYFGFSPEQLVELGGRVTTYRTPRAARHGSLDQAAEAERKQQFLAGGDFHRAIDPAEGLWASARSLGRFYEHLCAQLGERGGSSSPLDGVAVRELVRAQRSPMFEESPLIEFGLGVTLESRRHGERYAYFGSHTGQGTFGHQGHGWSPMAYADPDRQLVLAFNGNGLPGRTVGKIIWHRVSDAVYAAL